MSALDDARGLESAYGARIQMKTIRSVTSTSLILAGLVSGCSSSGDDIWFPNDDPGGKADIPTIHGSDIPSAHADATKSYLLARRIDGLRQAGALDEVESRLAQRIDGIIANMPTDGRLHLAELVRMEDPAIHDSLFPDEAAALPGLWKKVEAPSTNALVVGPDASFGVLDTASPPGPAVPPANLAIAALATDLQSAANRLQNVYNADGDAATVMLTDLDNGIANPGAFTPAEVSAFSTIKAIFREKAVATSDATLVVSPPPGPFTHAMTLGPIAFEIAGSTRYEEERTHANSALTVRFIGTQSTTATATLPMDAKVLLIHKELGSETVFGTGPVPALSGGPHVVEVWQAGVRVFSTTAQLPVMTREQRLELNDKLDYTLTTGLSPLVRNTVSATATGSTFTAKFSYDKATVPPTGVPNATALQRTATPTVKIPVGRYAFPQAQATLLVFPNNVLWVQRGTTMFRLLPQSNGTLPSRFVNTQLSASFEAANSAFSMSSPSLNTVVTASMRDI